jgi:hypothetical protein
MADGRRVQPVCPQAAGHGRRRAARRWRYPWGAWMCCDFQHIGRSRRFRFVHIALSLRRLPLILTLDQLFYRDTINPEPRSFDLVVSVLIIPTHCRRKAACHGSNGATCVAAEGGS